MSRSWIPCSGGGYGGAGDLKVDCRASESNYPVIDFAMAEHATLHFEPRLADPSSF
jgi:hypothetical protein